MIKKFHAKSVFGYLDFDINFHRDVSFVIGGNGSGKTTALKLINALLTPSFSDLLFIPFSQASVEVAGAGEIVEIFAESSGGYVNLRVSGVDDVLTLPVLSDGEFDYINGKARSKEEFVEDVSRKSADHAVVKRIASLPSPVFLGLDRKREDVPAEMDGYYYERNRVTGAIGSRAIRARRVIRGTLGVSLMETEFLVQEAYRRMRKIEESYSARLRDSILLSAFQYTDFDYDDVIGESAWQRQSLVLKRKAEVKDALLKVGVNDSRLSRQVDNFFNRLDALFESVQGTGEKFHAEFLTNKAQIDRILKIVEIIDDHKSRIDKVFRPINSFLDTINWFYQDSKKKLAVDGVGQLVVERPDGKRCTIEGLSSGERQLLVIFAHAYFNRYGDSSSIFIIDEPEISLHLRWQEKFAGIILGVSPNSQFIMATHSPEIVGDNKGKAVRCR